MLADDGFQQGKQGLLGVELFDDGFDHDRGSGEAAEFIRQRDACDRRIGVGRGHPAFGDQGCEHVRQRTFRLRRCPGLRVDKAHIVARLRGDLRNAASHQARADDADDFVAGCIHD